ncbi:DNA polymerase III subunit chi [Orrella sp. JC864]|uniref:DNA polymerase III subunit chi n=1 Tax=Orrella sp. JC864 TaxID=3120298 RepID=UPI0012BD3E85
MAGQSKLRIDFAFGAPDRVLMACQTAGKRYHAGQRVLVYCSDRARLAAFDRMLWTYQDDAFVPHVMADDPLAADTAVVLTAQAPVPPPAAGQAEPAWLLNLDDACPPGYEQFARIMEIVSDEPEDRQAARQRWRTYQAAGHALHAHDLKR